MVVPDIGEFYRDCFPMYKKYKKGKITQEEFSKYIESVNLKPFSAETTTRYSPTALGFNVKKLCYIDFKLFLHK